LCFCFCFCWGRDKAAAGTRGGVAYRRGVGSAEAGGFFWPPGGAGFIGPARRAETGPAGMPAPDDTRHARRRAFLCCLLRAFQRRTMDPGARERTLGRRCFGERGASGAVRRQPVSEAGGRARCLCGGLGRGPNECLSVDSHSVAYPAESCPRHSAVKGAPAFRLCAPAAAQGAPERRVRSGPERRP